MLCFAMQCNTMQCNVIIAVQFNAMQCNAIQCNAMKCSVPLLVDIWSCTESEVFMGAHSGVHPSLCHFASPKFCQSSSYSQFVPHMHPNNLDDAVQTKLDGTLSLVGVAEYCFRWYKCARQETLYTAHCTVAGYGLEHLYDMQHRELI